MTKWTLFSLIVLGITAQPSFANTHAKLTASPVVLEIEGKIFPKDEFPESCKDLFKGGKCEANGYGTYHTESVKQGDQIYSKATFTGPEGIQVIEESWEKDGRVFKAAVENRILSKKSELEVKNGKVYYKTIEKDGSVKTSDSDAEENLVVPSTVMSYVRPRFPELLAGKDVRLKVAVLDRRDSFTFNMRKIREEKSPQGDTIMVLEMKPTSIIIKAFVDKMLFYVRPKTGEMFAFEGKSSLKRKVGDSYKDLIVNSAYVYKVNAFNQPACDPLSALDKNQIPKCEVKSHE